MMISNRGSFLIFSYFSPENFNKIVTTLFFSSTLGGEELYQTVRARNGAGGEEAGTPVLKKPKRSPKRPPAIPLLRPARRALPFFFIREGFSATRTRHCHGRYLLSSNLTDLFYPTTVSTLSLFPTRVTQARTTPISRGRATRRFLF